jgi:hypothetical protein
MRFLVGIFHKQLDDLYTLRLSNTIGSTVGLMLSCPVEAWLDVGDIGTAVLGIMPCDVQSICKSCSS